MLAIIDKPPQFRGKYKRKSCCQWLRITGKTYIIESNDSDDSDDSDSDNHGLINGNKPVLRIHRRPGIFQLFKT